jgi:hypothetical protein
MAGMTVTYQYPVSGASPPSAALMKKKTQVIVNLAYVNGANDATVVTHNLGVSTDGSDGQPVIRCTLVVQGATSEQPIVAFTTANTVTVTPHVTGATAGFTAQLVLERRK